MVKHSFSKIWQQNELKPPKGSSRTLFRHWRNWRRFIYDQAVKIKIYKSYELMNTNYHPLSANITLPKILLLLLIIVIIIIVIVIIIMFYYCNCYYYCNYYYYYFVIIILVMIAIIIIIQYQYLGNCPSTPPLTQH